MLAALLLEPLAEQGGRQLGDILIRLVLQEEMAVAQQQHQAVPVPIHLLEELVQAVRRAAVLVLLPLPIVVPVVVGQELVQPLMVEAVEEPEVIFGL
jgi:hypothetical protein